MATVQWYQSSNTVTASLGLKGIPPDCSGDITARFREQYCAVYVGDSVYWECHLVGRIVPEKCKLSVGRVRAELKLKKADPQHWSEFEAEPAPGKNQRENGKSLPTGNGLLPASLPPTSLPPTSLPPASLPPTSLPPASLSATTLPAASPPDRPFLSEELTYLNHLPHDWFDMGEGVVVVKVRVRAVDQQNCQVAFNERALEIRFQTSRSSLGACTLSPQERNNDQKFLKTCAGSCPTDTFTWGIQLFDSILPAESSFCVKPTCMELRLKKAGGLRWKALERRQYSPGITSNHLDCIRLTNHVQEPSQQLTNQNTDLNDMDVDTDPPRPKSHTPNFESSDDVTMTLPQERDALISSTAAMLRGGSPSSSSPSLTPTQGSPYPTRYSPTTSKLSHSHIPPAAMETTDPSYRYTQLRRPSMTGLCNTGNTCFMNSVVQCLSNTRGLRDYFIEGHYLADINKVNPLGFKGELAKCFSMIIRKLWSGEYEYFSAVKLKNVIVSRSSNFSGYQQHDSHEFMSYLLDGLHEDLNRVHHKPQTQPVEMEDCSDVKVADQSWKVHKQRNDSYFVDHFQGQFKSTLVCPVCSKVSMTFDPFMSLSVPIPKNLRHLPIIFIPKDPDQLPRQYILKLPHEARLELLKASVARKTGIPMTHLRVFEAYSGKFQTLMSSNLRPIKSIGDNDIIIICEVLSRQEAGGEVAEFNVIQRVQLPLFPTKCSTCGRVAEEGRKLQRCAKCKAVGYCNRTCQSSDWSEHKLKCRGGRPVPVGLPFVVSLAASQLTYAKLSSMVEKIARRSVEIERMGMKPLGTEESTCGAQGSAEEEQRTMYTLTPVDRYGDSVEGATPLEDKGDEVLTVGRKFLAMDWKNNTKQGGCITITAKTTMDYQKDPTATASSHSAGRPITLEQCLEHLTEPETLSQEEAWYCPRCKEHREATKQMLVWRLPHVLIIHLKRFSFVNYIWRDKIDEMVSFPLRGLDMSPYMLKVAVQPNSPPTYDLYATVNHYGIVYGGHYSATVKPPTAMETGSKDWLCYDDDKVAKLPEDSVVSKYTYILFYCRRDYLQTKP